MALEDKLILVDSSTGANVNREFITIGVAGQNNTSIRRTTPFDPLSYSELLLVQGPVSSAGIRTITAGLKLFRTNASGLSQHISISSKILVPSTLTALSVADVRSAQSLMGLFLGGYQATAPMNRVILEQQI